MARPSEFSQETADYICEQLIEGRSLRSICLEDGMPAGSTVCRWLSANDEFRKQYAHAREMQADALFDDCLAIADGTAGIHGLDVQDRRLQIDTRKWMAGKLASRRYGDKLDVTSDGQAMGLVVFRGLNDADG